MKVARCAPASSIRAAATGTEVVNLALGEPTWDLSSSARSALGGGVERWGYGAHAGEVDLRREIASYEGAHPDEVLVTAGAQGALFAVVQTYVGPDDAALVPDPGFPGYRALVEVAGGRAVPYPLGDRGELDAEVLIERLDRTPEARIVFLNHPGNPTGGPASAAALARVAEACAERGVLVVSDEVYRELHCELDEGAQPSLRSVTHAGLVMGSVSKAWAAPGLRVGWLVGDPDLVEPCRRVHALMTTHAATTSQAAALALLRDRERNLPKSRSELARRWDALRDAWRETTGADSDLRRTGLYHWIDLREVSEAEVTDEIEFCLRAREERGVALVPGSAFGERGQGWARLSVGATPEQIREGVRRLTGLLSVAEGSRAA